MPLRSSIHQVFFILDSYESETQHAEYRRERNPSEIIFQRHSTRSLAHTHTDRRTAKKAAAEKTKQHTE